MNYLLSLNKKFVLILSFLSIASILIYFSFKYILILENDFGQKKITFSKVDITEPRFAINSSTQKIIVSAKEGNFIDEDKILLRKNVLFKSNKFIIKSDNVIFDRNEMTANSNQKSIFTSDKTKILSDGFDIYDNGNIIVFKGKSKVELKWNFFILLLF